MASTHNVLKVMIVFIVLTVIFIIFLVLLCCNSSSGDYSILVANYLSFPLESSATYEVKSEFGNRLDPLGSGQEKFHTGIDLATAEGTTIIASGGGYVVGVGFEENGLGNYVYIEHNFSGLIFYTVYGHMQDDSIVVSEGQPVKKGDKIGCVGSTGASTGFHLHFTITAPVLSFKKEHLIDPKYVIYGLT